MTTAKIDAHYRSFSKKVDMLRIARERYLQAFKTDPLAGFMINKLRLSPLKSGLAGFFLVALTYLAGGVVFSPGAKGIIGPPSGWLDALYDFSMIPITFFFFVWLAARLPYLFLRLHQNGVSLAKAPDLPDFAAHVLHKRVFNKTITTLAVMLALGLAAVHFVQILGGNAWGGAVDRGSAFHYLKIFLIWIPAWYMFFTIFARELVFIREFRRAVRNYRLNLNLTNPDKCGGLRPLAEYLLQFSYYNAACGFGLSLLIIRSIKFGDFGSGILVHLGIVAYLIVSFLLFLSPFHPIFLLMRKMKADIRARAKTMEWLIDRILPLEILYKHAFATFAPVVVLFLFIFKLL
ncbi:MAG TPA: hypothetical protein ENN40_08750 [Candidatus Aminicenantes bacterium]|nr:hypothetical protein [Candidatus Aminicenantes bacterium]